MIENRQLRYFIAVARFLHFTRAAEALHIAQPALSRNIREIEEELGVELFLRTHKRVTLTDAGQAFLAEAERTLQQLENATVTAQRAARGELGRLVMGYSATAGIVAVPELVSAFRQRYPSSTIVLSEMSPERLETALRKGDVDVALVYGSSIAKEFASRELKSDRHIVVLPQNHRLASRERVNLKDLADDRFILPSRAAGGSRADEILEECRYAGFAPRSGNEIATSSVQTTLGLISAGLGVTLIPSSLQLLSRTGAVYRPLQKTRVVIELNLMWRPQQVSAVLRSFLNLAFQSE
jgi:DNA-binding transcriptional LysR family regulator